MGQFADAARKVRDLKDNLEDEHDSATEDGLDRVNEELEAALELNDSVARPFLITDINTGLYPGDEMVSRSVDMPEWAKFLEHGTGIYSDEGYSAPSQPPYAAIREWFTEKGLTPLTGDVGASSALIAEQISVEGSEAHKFIDPVWTGPFGMDYIVHRNAQAQQKALRRSFR
jgi:hypothetical protein